MKILRTAVVGQKDAEVLDREPVVLVATEALQTAVLRPGQREC